jgi:hypothetical protein
VGLGVLHEVQVKMLRCLSFIHALTHIQDKVFFDVGKACQRFEIAWNKWKLADSYQQ